MTPADLKVWLRDHDFTPRELAHELGVHWTAVYKWLSGEMRLTPLNERALAQLALDERGTIRRQALRMTVANLRTWMAQQSYSVTDLGYAFDMPDRAVLALLEKEETEMLPRLTVLALRELSRGRRIARPQGMEGGEFSRWLATNRLSQKSVADALGVTMGAVSRWAAGNRDVSPMTRLALKTLERRR